jgi:mannitol/fructose-specific phosphotransferase system IIA component (Ntr-type)
VTAFVRLREPVVVGDYAEEGYRTRHIFCCLSSKEEADEVWEIGRSFAVLMAQEQWGEAIDKAESPDDILAVMDKYVGRSSTE